MVTITISDRFIYERVLKRRFSEKMNAKSVFPVLDIVIWCGWMQKKNDEKTILFLLIYSLPHIETIIKFDKKKYLIIATPCM